MFDRFVVVDWSANSTPKRGRDSIWIAVLDDAGLTVENPSTRTDAGDRLEGLVEQGRPLRTLIGVDFSVGYPAGTAAALELAGDPWRSTAALLTELVVDGDRNANNRFEVAARFNATMTGGPAPFWGCPPSRTAATLSATKPASFAPVAEWRVVEAAMRAQGLRPFSSWQLLGAGAVGGQSLLGIPLVWQLLERGGGRVSVWPMTTGLRAPELRQGSVVIAEVWPSMVDVMADATLVRDEAQVRATAAWLASLDGAGQLEELFTPAVRPDWRSVVVAEEGWVLGVVG